MIVYTTRDEGSEAIWACFTNVFADQDNLETYFEINIMGMDTQDIQPAMQQAIDDYLMNLTEE